MKFFNLFFVLLHLLFGNSIWTVESSDKQLTHYSNSTIATTINNTINITTHHDYNNTKKQLVKCLPKSNYLDRILSVDIDSNSSNSQNFTQCPHSSKLVPLKDQGRHSRKNTTGGRSGRRGRASVSTIMLHGIPLNSPSSSLSGGINDSYVDSGRQKFGDHCECWNSSDGSTVEVECACSHLPSPSFTLRHVNRLTLENSGTFKTLSNEGVRPYADDLSELILIDLLLFQEIKDEAFIGLPNLTSIYIVGAPALTHISSNVFKGSIPKLKSIKIVHTGLQVTPMFNQLRTEEHHLQVVDLENNKIASIEDNWIENIKTDHLNLNYNSLRSIGSSAFKGATIARLSLKGNSQLTTLDPNCFSDVISLRELDLSETAIVQLPTHGLKKLDVLILEKVFTLTVIPSIYHFDNLREAAMTFPYHCCAFNYPETHDPTEFKEFVMKMKKCERDQKSNVKDDTPNVAEIEANKRSKRNILTLTRPRQRHQQKQLRGARDLLDALSNNNNTSTSNSLEKSKYHKKIGESGENFIGGGGSKNNHDHLNTSLAHHEHFELVPHKENPKNDFDPFTLDPDKAFGKPMETHVDMDGDTSRGTGHVGETDNTGDFGVFHSPLSTVAPSVTFLCGDVARKKILVKCSPLPDAFSPCEDIMGNNWLRVAVWFVVLFSLLGNITVLVVLFLSISRVNVQRLLIANLAWSDFCMAIYLFMVAAEDLLSLGVYFNHAIDWQLGWGCQIAGFLTVFASELSVFTLTVITGERWYALTRAIHLTKRLTIGGAAKLMAVGWFLAFILALLPLVGVSSYSKTSICLPMEANTITAQVYLVFLLLFNGLAFILVTIAYLKMYKAVAGHGGHAAHTADLAIAKKMALLVFTNFACWAPVAFFGLTAVSGQPLIGVTEAKILLVFFYPLNSILNPYLYAILTKQFRRDFFLMLSRHGLCTELAAKHREGAVSTNNTVQTMQTTLRIGSVTESTRVGGRMSMSSASGGCDAGHEHNSPLMGKFALESRTNNHGRMEPNKTTVNNSKSSVKSTFLTFGHISSSNTKGGGGHEPKKNSRGINMNKSSPFHDDQSDCEFDTPNDRFSAETSFIAVPSRSFKNRRQNDSKLPPILDDGMTTMTTFGPSSNA